MTKVTFLFGAGASANVLPTVTLMPERLYNFRNALAKFDKLDEKHKTASKDLIKDIDSLIDATVKLESENSKLKFIPRHASIDTYAKKLWITGEKIEFRKLKIILSLFFNFEEREKGVDMRYDGFFASIIKNSPSNLPTSIRIISWNYDSQFEMAFADFSKNSSKAKIQDTLGIFSKNIFPRLENVGSAFMPTTRDTFSIFKINGTAAVYHSPTGDVASEADYSSLYDELCDKYLGTTAGRKDFDTALSFSWETEHHSAAYGGIIDVAIKGVKETEVLVVIGYSFPFFNREVDKQIIEAMNLKKVYIQDMSPEGIKERFLGMSNLTEQSVVLKSNCDQFFLPNELSI